MGSSWGRDHRGEEKLGSQKPDPKRKQTNTREKRYERRILIMLSKETDQ